MTDLKDIENTRELLQKKIDSCNLASTHHAKIMQQLKDMGFTPNPIQQVVVDEPLNRDTTAPFENDFDINKQNNYFC